MLSCNSQYVMPSPHPSVDTQLAQSKALQIKDYPGAT